MSPRRAVRPRPRPRRRARAPRREALSPATVKRQRGEALPDFPRGVGELDWGERGDVLDAWTAVLDGIYAHLPLKRALYGYDVVRAIAHLRKQIPSLNHLQFYRELTFAINRLRDAHTQYFGTRTQTDAVARLPFLVEVYETARGPSYVVSKVSRRMVDDPHFVEGVTIESWNGIPFDRAVDLHAEGETGGRPDARRARALDSLTVRPLDYQVPPDERRVVIGYLDDRKVLREIRFDWRAIYPSRAPITKRRKGTTRGRRAIHEAGEIIRRAKKLMFNPKLWEQERKKGAPRRRKAGAGKWGDVLAARTVHTRLGDFGHLRIWGFDVDDDQGFVNAAIQMIERLPDRGLILDLRNNPGGYIIAAERLLQLFTPQRVLPTKFALRATPMTALMASAPLNRDELGPWSESLLNAASTGEPYSRHVSISSEEECNDVGQRYGGPVVAIVDANTYSAGDLFAAGIVDNRIGPLVCIGAATGAGGANVWSYDDLRDALDGTPAALPALPRGVTLQVAVRRAVRIGPAEGVLIEDAGIPGQPYGMTRRDLFESNVDLMERCTQLLAAQPWSRLAITRRRRTLTLDIANLDQLDLFFDGHPAGPPIRPDSVGPIQVQLPPGTREVEVTGYAEGILRQRRRLPITDR